jgi:DnaJ domain
MEARNAAARGPESEGSLGAARGSGNRRLRELDWQSLPCVKLPLPSFRRDEWRRQRRLPAAQVTFEVQAAGWRLNSVEELPAALRPDPAFRRFHPLASGLLMLDDLGNAQGFGDSEAAVLRYDRAGRLAAKAGFAHKLYRLGLHPLGREFIAMSADCILSAYDDDLRLLWRTTLADAPQLQALRRRFAICDEWLKNHIRCVALARDRSGYLFTAVDQAWCVDAQGEVLWGLKLPLRDGWTRFVAQAAASVEVGRALALMELALPVTPLQVRRRYRELALRWHPDRNDNAQAHEQMTALNSAVELLSGIDERLLSGEGGATSSGDEGTEFNCRGADLTMTLGFDERLDADWIYAADFAAHSNAVYLGSYRGRVVMIDPEGEARRVYNVGITPRRIIDRGEFLYILTHPALYVLRDGSLENMIDLLDGGELVMAPNGFGVLETKRLRWFGHRANCSVPFFPLIPSGASISPARGS